MIRRLRSFHVQLVLGFVAGIVGGSLAHVFLRDDPALERFNEWVAVPIGQVFLRLLFMLVIPLVFSALILGITGFGDLRSLGRIGVRTLAYAAAVSSVAVALGITLVNIVRPGDGLSEETRAKLLETAGSRPVEPVEGSAIDLIISIVPRNPIAAAANGDVLAVMFFAVMVGIALALTRTDAARHFERVIEGLYDVTMRLIHIVIRVAPIGVAALLFTLTSQLGYELLGQLARYVGVVLLALALQQFVVYSLIVRFMGSMSPRRFFGAIKDAMVVAFSTSSSNATLPTALDVAENELKLPPQVGRFVLTIGATANQNGTALFEGVTVLFLAQLYGVDLSFAQQTIVVLVCILGGIGTAGVPSGSIPVITMILGIVGIPIQGIALILGVDRLLDMCRTVVNVSGDLAAATVISRGEGWRPPA